MSRKRDQMVSLMPKYCIMFETVLVLLVII